MICITCSGAELDCCHLRGDPALTFGLTVSDVQRISRVTGLRPREFSKSERIPRHAYVQIESVNTNLLRMFPERRRLALRFEGKNNACYFWREGSGCSLDRNQRPRTCSLYPFWYTKNEDKYRISVQLASPDRCMAICSKTNQTLKSLEQSREQISHFVKLSDTELDHHASLSSDAIDSIYEEDS